MLIKNYGANDIYYPSKGREHMCIQSDFNLF